MDIQFAEPEERLATMVRAGTGSVELMAVEGYPPVAEFPLIFAALHRGDLVIGIPLFGGEAELLNAAARVELLDCVYPGELGSTGASLIGACHCDGGAGRLIRRIAAVGGALRPPNLAEQRALALEIAEDLAHPELLAVGAEVRLAIIEPASVDLVEPTGCQAVDPADLLLAEPDPFSDIEAVWLARLNDPASGVTRKMIDNLCVDNPQGMWSGESVPPRSAAVTAMDRFGVTLSALDHLGVRREWRLGFGSDCVTIADLGREIRELCGMCPGRGALHPRNPAR
ncbi:hypothetical protein [Dietzia sp.]|uniref:hypothetical protein n=1 Tax=Dietzia sp. TaxID=1871616 RepID=UPI002FDA076B